LLGQSSTSEKPNDVDFVALANAGPFELVRALYKNDYGQPFEMTPGQVEIFSAIFFKQGPGGENRIHIKTFTQFGKSDVVAMAILTRACTFPEKWSIVAPSQSKARIIMGYVIKHLFENEYTLNRFKIDPGENIDAVRRERSKNRMTFDTGDNQMGEIFILSAESRLKQTEDVGNSLMGFGCFDYDQMILTDHGEIKIGELVAKKLDYKIASFNEKIGIVEWKKILSWQDNERGGRGMVKIKTGRSSTLCTQDHPVYILGRGWVEAQNIEIGDDVFWIDKYSRLAYNKVYANHKMRLLREGFLQETFSYFKNKFQHLWSCLPGKNAFGKKESGMERGGKKVPYLWKNFQGQGDEILLPEMYGDRENARTDRFGKLLDVWEGVEDKKSNSWKEKFLQSYLSWESKFKNGIDGWQSELAGGNRQFALVGRVQQKIEKKDQGSGWRKMCLLREGWNIANTSHQLQQEGQLGGKFDFPLREMSWKNGTQSNFVDKDTIRSVGLIPYIKNKVYNIEVEENHNYFIDGILVHNSPNLVEDEAALISDESDAKAMRMVGGFTSVGLDFVVKIGNPFARNHFLQAQEDPAYYKINIDARRGILEGRLTQKFVDEMEKKPYFSVLYANEFPGADDIDSKGWTQLLSEEEVEIAMVKEGEEIKHIGERRMGNDVARGGNNYTTWVLRSMNYMELLAKSHQDNLTEVAGQTIFLASENKVRDENIFIDDVGVGGGAVDPLRYQQKKVHGVNVGNKAMDDKRFSNLRAEAYWRMREWIKKGGRLSKTEDWYELAKVKYKPDSKGRLRVMSKDDMRAKGIDSPDIADGGMLTFVQKDHGDLEEMKRKREAKKRKRVSGRGLRVSMGGY
jgi:hypothetical protein